MRLIVTFHPDHLGLHSEKLLMLCDNGKMLEFQVSGSGEVAAEYVLIVLVMYPRSVGQAGHS